ncbi:MAG: hypothetical protein K6A74_09445, partial [Lachnospiraceae bacterium]|nr:hypothetical protein [Lachnospiraceae bacterium]
MRFKKAISFLLVFTLLAGGISPVYADDVSLNDIEYEEEVSGSSAAESFLFDVSEGDISADEGEDIADPDISETVETVSDISSNDVSENDISANETDIIEVEEDLDLIVDHGESIASEFIEVPAKILADKAASAVYFSKYYNQIDPVAQKIYKAFEDKSEAFLEHHDDQDFFVQVDLVLGSTPLFSDEERTAEAVKESFMNAYAAFDYDHPEIFWFAPSNFTYAKGTNKNTGLVSYVKLKLNSKRDSLLQAPYDSDPGLVEAERSEREVFADYIISLTEKESDLNAKLGIINDELTNYSYYNRYISSGKEYIKNTDKRAYESISAMTLQSWLTSSDDNGDTAAPVCEGYSRAFKMICDRIGIDCIVVPGHTSSSGTGAHMWNFVRDPFGFWYAVDVTWDDPLRADEWKNRITPDDQIRNYFLVGGKTKRGGSTFESRHIADGPFWKDGTAFAVPPLCDVTYDENTENCVFFAAVTDDETVVINAESEQFKYTKSLAQAIEYTNGLSEANPDRKVVFQLNCDFNFAYDALKDLSKASNIYLSLNGFEVTFAQNGHWSVPALNIVDSKGEGYIINLTGDSDVSGNVLFDSANVLCNGYDLTVEPNVTIALKSLEAADFDLPEGSQLNFSKFSGKNVTLGRNSTLVAETLDCAGALTLTANSKLYASTLFAENITLAEGCVLVADNIDCKGTITVSGGSKLIIKGERSEIGAVDISAGETDPYILRGKETELTILDGVTSPDESGMLNFGILDVYDLNASDCFLLNTADLPLIDSGAVLFASLNEGSNAKLVRYISKSPNETDVVYEKGLVVAKDILAHLYALNTESGTKTHMESFHTLGEAFAHITAIANTSKGYEIILTGDTEINGSMTVPSKCDSLTIKGQKSFADATPITHTIEVSGPVSFPVDVTLENVILKADSLTAKKRLTLRSSQILLSTDLSVETLDMTDSLIDAEGTVSIKSLVLRGDSNEIYYLPDNTSYIVPDGSAVLYRDGEFSAAFADLNDALKAITKVSDVNSDYRIVLYEDAKEEGTKLSLPKAGYAHSVTITSNGEAKKVYIKNALTLGCDVKLENIALYSSSKVAVKLNKYALSLEGVSFGGDTYISTITGSSVSGASALRLSDMGTLYVGKVSKVGTLQLSDHTALYAGDDMTVGLLDMDAGSALTTMRKATVSSIARPEGTWNITLDITKNKAGEITKVETPAKINGDFDEFEEGKLTLTPLGYEARDINLVYAPKLTVGVANGGTYEELIAIGNAPTLHATKKKGYIVGTDESFNAALVYDENKAIALADVSTALSEINKLATKRDYRILLLSDAQSKITSLPKTKYASSLSFEGTGQTLESSGKLSFSNDVTFKAVSLSHTGKLTLGNVTEKENVTLSTTGALTVKNIVSEDSLVIKNTISSGKSQITVKGSVTAASPIMIHLFKDKAQTSYAKVGMTVDDVRYERLVLKATGSALASSFRLAEGNLKSGCRYYSDENFTDIFSDEAYVLSKSGSDINLVYAENVEAALVTGEVFDGNMPGKGNGRILGFYGAINEAFAEIDALGDETAIYSVVIFKSTIPADILLPSHAMKVIVSGGIKGSGTYIEDEQGHVVENDPYYMYSVNFKNNVNVHCDTVFSYVELGCKSTLAFNVKEGSLELVNMVVPKVG